MRVVVAVLAPAGVASPQAEAEEAVEREKRADLIRQIKALESVRAPRTQVCPDPNFGPFPQLVLCSIRDTQADMTQSSGAGLLTEMSFVELRERLSRLKV